jgi:hypothetical protein
MYDCQDIWGISVVYYLLIRILAHIYIVLHTDTIQAVLIASERNARLFKIRVLRRT